MLQTTQTQNKEVAIGSRKKKFFDVSNKIIQKKNENGLAYEKKRRKLHNIDINE